jgi:hypothetical protein
MLKREHITCAISLLAILVIAACSPGSPAPTPTPPPSNTPTLTPPPLVTPRATNTPRLIASWTPTDAPTPTATRTRIPATITPTGIPATRVPTLTPTPNNRREIARTNAGRPIEAFRYGDGPNTILLIGGVHGGWEANTVTLMNALRDHFADNPDDIAPGYAVEIIPVMNPDGLAVGQDIEGRFNANGVDLNRNWACGWQPEAVWREGPVDAGGRPFSELESASVAAYIGETRPVVVLFYHSAANGVFAGDCPLRGGGAWRSGQMSAVYGDASGYSYGQAFSAYPVTGTAASWVDGQGIPSADVELASASDPETARNLRGVLAVQCWLQGPACAEVPR